MEHRWNPRISTDTRVTLYHHRIPVIVTKAHNISKGGVFVASRAMTYSKNTLLDVKLRLPTANGIRQFTVPSYVVYGTDDGMGLVFLDTNPELNQALSHIMGNEIEAKPAADRNTTKASLSNTSFFETRICVS